MKQQKSYSLIIRWIFIAGTILRLALALSRNDLVWPDEHFMSLEPASKIVFDRAYLAWEWNEGYRSWTLPLLYTPILWICKLFGISGGLIPIHAGRVFTALASSFALFKFYKLIQLLKFISLSRLIAFASFSLATPMVLWGTTSLADHWVMILWLCVLPTCIRFSRQDENTNWLKMGVLAGLPILAKPQAGILAFALFLNFLCERKQLKKIAFYCTGVLVNVLGIGILDQIAYGKFCCSIIQHLLYGKQKSITYGVSPWYDYFPRLWNDQGSWFFVFLGIIFLMSFNELKKRLQKRSLKGDLFSFVVAPILAYFFFHLIIPHKETRFLLPVLPLFYLMGGWVFQFLPQRFILERWLSQGLTLRFAVPLLIVILSFISFARALTADIYLSSVNISSLEDKVYHLQSKSDSQETCLLLLDHNWSWTRGNLILGDHVKFIEKQISDIDPDIARPCRYAILKENHVHEFNSRAGSPAWSFIKRTPHGFVLIEKKIET